MYQIGDKVVYPVHGAGVVEAIESREIGGRNRQYYVLNLPYSGANGGSGKRGPAQLNANRGI